MKPDPSLLCHPNIPIALYGLAPRVIFGKAWWANVKNHTLVKAEDCCEACGVELFDVKGRWKWLECHEVYEINFTEGISKYIKTVALCPYCHKFIHSGHSKWQLEKGEITQQEFDEIRIHGKRILMEHNLFEKWYYRNSGSEMSPPDHQWKLIIEGKTYTMRELEQFKRIEGETG